MKKSFVFLLFIIPASLFAQELRTALAYDYKLNKKNKLDIQTEWRSDFEQKTAHFIYVNLGYNYRLNKQFKFKISHRYSFEMDKVENNRYRATFDVIYQAPFKVGESQIDNRLRLQYAKADWEKNYYTLRDRIRFQWELNKKTSPYLAFEGLYTFKVTSPYEGRMTLGSEFDLGKIDFDFFYKIELSDAYKTVLFHHVIGTAWIF